MSKLKRNTVRGVRKAAHLSRRVLSVGANYSGKVENKAHRIINGLDNSIVLEDKIQFEKLYYESLKYITPLHPALPFAGRKPRTTLLIPSLQKSSFFGGTATALIFAAITANESNTPLAIVETLKRGRISDSDIEEFFESNNIKLPSGIQRLDISPRKYNNYGYIDLHPDDVFICSAWWDAYLIQTLPLIKKFIYLIQDYEPIFYNNSDLYVLAESTYNSDRFVPVCNTELMLDFMKSKNYQYIAENALYFEPAVNIGKKIGVEIDNNKSKKTLFVYGRPNVERNLFYTALKVLDELFTEQKLIASEWECYMAGQDGLANIVLSSGAQINSLGKMNMTDYYNFAKSVDLAVSLMMAPHPSYPPLELSSLGAAVVTTKYETKTDLSRYNKNLFVSDIEIEELKKNIIEASNLSSEKRKRNALETQLEDDWVKSISQCAKSALSKA